MSHIRIKKPILDGGQQRRCDNVALLWERRGDTSVLWSLFCGVLVNDMPAVVCSGCSSSCSPGSIPWFAFAPVCYPTRTHCDCFPVTKAHDGFWRKQHRDASQPTTFRHRPPPALSTRLHTYYPLSTYPTCAALYPLHIARATPAPHPACCAAPHPPTPPYSATGQDG